MNKSILIKAVVVLLVAVLVHSVFWFFKTGQLEKNLNNFIAENAATISVAEIKVVGYPLSQKVIVKDLKFAIPHAAFGKQQIIIKNMEAVSTIFSSDFVVEIMDKITTQDSENNSGLVEFNQNPQISFSVADGIIAKFNYSDNGYKIFDVDKNIIYSAASSTITIDSTIDDNDQVVSKILVTAKDIEGFDVLDIYKNSSEKKVIDGIKTGEILIGGGANNALISSEPFVDPALPAGIVAPAVVAPSVVAPAVVAPVTAAAQDPAKAAEVAAVGSVDASVAGSIAAAPIDVASVVAKNDVIKNNLSIDIEYTLTPTKNEQQSSVPLDPTQIQEVTTQYSRTVKINNIEFSNSLYKISLNGQSNYFQDDSLPSGFVTIKVENIDKLTAYIAAGLTQIAEQKQAIPEIQSSDLAVQSLQSQGTAYQEFLKKVVIGLPNVAKELAAKNQLSKDNNAIFDMRREKNLEFVINETPLREVLGKF